jgi:DNA-binding IclR family transcriptional regulator
VGATYSLLRGAAGKALLAFLPQRDIDRLVPTSTEPERLAKELVAIRAAGYATSRGEVVAGATAVAVPVLDSEGAARAVINVTGPADRFTAERMAAAVDAIREVAESITRQLGGAVADAGAN